MQYIASPVTCCWPKSTPFGANYRAYNQERPGNTGANTDRQTTPKFRGRILGAPDC